MDKEKIMENHQAKLFVEKVVREVPVDYYYKGVIRDELFDKLFAEVEQGKTFGEAITVMGRPAKLGKEYRGQYKSTFPRYKRYSGLLFLKRWLSLIVYIILLLVCGGKTWCYIPLAIAAAFIAGLWGQSYPKWQYVLLNVFAPLVLWIPLAVILIISGEANFVDSMKLVFNTKIVLAWTIPAAFASIYCFIQTYLQGKVKNALTLSLVGVMIVAGSSMAFAASDAKNLTYSEFDYSLTPLIASLEQFSEDFIVSDSLSASLAAFDSYSKTVGARKIVYHRSRDFELSPVVYYLERLVASESGLEIYNQIFKMEVDTYLELEIREKLAAEATRKIIDELNVLQPAGNYYQSSGIFFESEFIANPNNAAFREMRQQLYYILEDLETTTNELIWSKQQEWIDAQEEHDYNE